MNEEWIEKKAKKMIEIQDNLWQRCRTGYMNNPEERCKDFIRSIVGDCKPKVSREWVYYFCAYINAGHKSSVDDKARVDHAIKKLEEIGVKVEG